MPFTNLSARSAVILLHTYWKQLVVADLLYKLIAFIILTPFLTGLVHVVVAWAGSAVLSDVDILLFLSGPFGWLCAIGGGALWLSIQALEQATLLVILSSSSSNIRIGPFESIRFVGLRGARILRIACRIVIASMLIAGPFLILAVIVYKSLLGAYDINYYLAQRPASFYTAIALGGILAIGMIACLLWFHAAWLLALPMVLFNDVAPTAALRESRRLVTGHHRSVLTWLGIWFLSWIFANTVTTMVVASVGRVIVPSSVGSLAVFTSRVGLTLILLFATSTALSVLGTVGFATLLFHIYQRLYPNAADSMLGLKIDPSPTSRAVTGLTRRRLLLATLVGAIVSAIAGSIALERLHMDDHAQVMAHRGSSRAAPENSMAAIQGAIESGADWVEIDVQETADSNVVVMHDSDFMKLAQNPLKIWNATLDDLRQIDIGSWFSPSFAAERVPTLKEVLIHCRGKINVVIELKYYGHDQDLERRVAEIVEQTEMVGHVMIMSLKPEGIKKMKLLRPTWKCGLLMSLTVGNIERIEADFVAINARFVNRRLINRFHRAGKQVYVWTVNDAANMSMLMNRGVNGILTDRPDLARQVLAQRAEMNSAERLLAEFAAILGAPETDAVQ